MFWESNGLSGALPPENAAGRPSGQVKDTRLQNHLPVPATQTMTGLLSVTATRTACSVPAAQFGVQSSSFSVPVPDATAESPVGQLMSHSDVVPSPDSGPPAAQAGAWKAVPPTDPP